jgi:hypothetical protein
MLGGDDPLPREVEPLGASAVPGPDDPDGAGAGGAATLSTVLPALELCVASPA